MATQAKITFAALNGESPISERTIALYPHHRTIQIGRASKTPSKGLQAAVDNAWFDSPVMSRNHAEISLDAESQAITIQDIGSMHGTFVNGSQIQRQEPCQLNNGDLVVFGAEVKRNLDTFPACAFKVTYEVLPFKANISYAFPETDDEEYEISDDDMEENIEPSSEDGVSIESPPRKESQAIYAIDLTRDDSPATSSVAEVEFTGVTAMEKNIMNTLAGRPGDIDHHADPVSIALYNGNPPILVDSGDDDTHFSSDSDDQSDEVEYDNGAASGCGSTHEQDSENEESSDHDIESQEVATSISRDFPDKESERVSGIASLGFFSFLNQPAPESNVRSAIGASENVAEKGTPDDESDFGLSDAGAEGIQALFDDGLVGNAGDPYFEQDVGDEESDRVMACNISTNALVADESLETAKRVTFASFPSEPLPEMSSSYSHSNPFVRSSQTENSLSQPVMNVRQPSPSDAAMMKTATTSANHFDESANPIIVHHLPSQDFQKLTAQSLGDKTGKHAFFAAREENKAKMYGEENQHEKTSSLQPSKSNNTSTAEDERERLVQASRRSRERKRQKEEEARAKLSEDSIKTLQTSSTTTKLVNFTIPPFSTFPYLDDHSQVPKAIPTPSPEPDMTSAATYNESKAAMSSTNEHSSNPSGRSGLSINDIIEGGSSNNTSKSLKRKPCDISDAIEDEIRIWASSPSALHNLEGSSAIPEETSQIAICEEQAENAPSPAPEIVEQRPAKRLRKIVESVGYVALGGATLFGALVLSAPDFL